MDGNPARYGYDERVGDIASRYIAEGLSLARVIEVNKNGYVVGDGMHEMAAQPSGKLLFEAEEPTALPTVGDWVAIRALDDFTLAVVHAVLPRKTVLKRKEAGRRIGFQLIASNIDIGLVVQSAESPNFNLLDRYLVMLRESGIEPLLLFNKADLLTDAETAELVEKLSGMSDRHLLLSTIAEGGMEELESGLICGKTYCLLGQSGVGKTSLLNRLLGRDAFRVSEVRESDGRGRHTTVRRQLVCLDCGAVFIDTPGMRELGNFGIEQALEETFEEFAAYASECRFRDCTHTHEAGCAVTAAVDGGELDRSRYDNYLKLRRESAHYDMSYRERRRKDKSLGKIVKNYQKGRWKS